jgi:hypothetical protein
VLGLCWLHFENGDPDGMQDVRDTKTKNQSKHDWKRMLYFHRSRSTTRFAKTENSNSIETETSLRHCIPTVKVAFTIDFVLYCITTVSAKMPWGLPGRRSVGTVKTGSVEESPHAADLTNCIVGDDGTTLRGGNDILPSNSTVEDDGTTVRGRYDIPPSNTPPSKKHAHHKGRFPLLSSLAENGLTNAGCCLADGVDSAAGRMANGRVEASMNIRNGMGEASMNIRNGMGDIRNGMVAVGVCMVVSVTVSSLLGRSK